MIGIIGDFVELGYQLLITLKLLLELVEVINGVIVIVCWERND